MPQDSDQTIPQPEVDQPELPEQPERPKQPKQPDHPEPILRWTCKQLENYFFLFKIILFPLVFAEAVFMRLYRWLCLHPWIKLAAFPVLLVIPVAYLWLLSGIPLPFQYYTNWGVLVSRKEAEQYESPLRTQVCPVLMEKYGLEECAVLYTRPGKCKKVHTEVVVVRILNDFGGALHFKIVSADHKRRIEIAQDIIRMKRELPGLPKCPYVLEFDQPKSSMGSWAPDGADSFQDPTARAVIGAIVIPDEECGYDGRGDWHFDDFTPTPGKDEEARK